MLGLDALVLFRQRRMALFFLFAMLLGAALQITNTFGNPFLHDLSLNPLYQDSLSVRYPAVLLSLSQISEVFFILTIPFFLRRYGIKQVMLISMAAGRCVSCSRLMARRSALVSFCCCCP